jgi:8-oxo-dGTP diphosphatase
VAQESMALPAIPVSAGALIFDSAGRLLILKPTYKSGWTIPGGVMEADGEVSRGRLAAMDFRPAKPGRLAGIRYLFDCGQVDDEALASVKLQPEEISDSRLVSLTEAFTLLRGPISRRVQSATQGHFYLEDGRPIL